MADSDMRRSPLYEAHRVLGAKLVDFGGWEMPLSYPSGTLAEHRACRTTATAFDVSHLGTVRVSGPGAFERLQATFTSDLSKIGPGRTQYTHLLDEGDASVVDDIIVWWVDDDTFDVMPNASNTAGVRAAVGGADTTEDRAVIAVQGPDARRLLVGVAPDAAAVPRRHVVPFTWRGSPCLAAGTGYTGEDGVECSVPAEAAVEFWEAVLATGVAPAGLGARDTLRLEAGLPLHGHELGRGITPLQAGLGWVVAWGKGPFRGRDALAKELEVGPARRLVGLTTVGRQPPRQGASIAVGEHTVGEITSGNFSPMLGHGIALGFVDSAVPAPPGALVSIDLRGRRTDATVVTPPFVPLPGRSAPPEGAVPAAPGAPSEALATEARVTTP